MNDPLVDEVRQVRDAHAARFQYDLDAIFRDIKEQERKSGHQFVYGVARPALPKPVLPTQTALSLTDNAKAATGSR